MAVADELARGEHGRHEFGAVDHGVEPALQKADQMRAAIALEADGLGVIAAELLLRDVAVIALQLLLGAQLRAEIGDLALAALTVLARTIFAAVERALRAAPKVLAQTAVDLVLDAVSLAHRVSCSAGPMPGMQRLKTGTRPLRPRGTAVHGTRDGSRPPLPVRLRWLASGRQTEEAARLTDRGCSEKPSRPKRPA